MFPFYTFPACNALFVPLYWSKSYLSSLLISISASTFSFCLYPNSFSGFSLCQVIVSSHAFPAYADLPSNRRRTTSRLLGSFTLEPPSCNIGDGDMVAVPGNTKSHIHQFIKRQI